MNLLSETIWAMWPHTPADVLWVGSDDFFFSWDDFAALSNVEYDDGYGGQEVASDLVVVGRDWWLERHEYDGSEWWEFKRLPEKPVTNKVPATLLNGGYQLRKVNP